MAKYTRALKCVGLVLSCGVICGADVSDSLKQADVSLRAECEKKTYAPGEPVVLNLSIANSGPKPVYIVRREPFITVHDANGTAIRGDPIPDPNALFPGSDFLRRDGKLIYIERVSEIPAAGVLLDVVPDALKRYHRWLSEGEYSLIARTTKRLYERGDLFARKEYPGQWWVEPKGGLPQIQLESNPVKIEIRKGRPGEVAIDKSGAGAGRSRWTMVLICTLGGAIVLGIGLFLLKRAASPAGKLSGRQ